MRNAINGLKLSVATVGVALAIFLPITIAVRFSIATAVPSEAASQPSPIPSYGVSHLHP
ncbi:MAG TPA: hypothetical protein VJQ08_02430 [Candidatus Dormibacteraeota bacterium]|nr:hypothetical protein [Candidatus Dormibacteraeota bacterium]